MLSQIVNEAITKSISVQCREMTVEEAKLSGAIGIFDQKHGQTVKVFSIEGYSVEICGDPHASNTSELGFFEIIKEESLSAGVRRIRAIIRKK